MKNRPFLKHLIESVAFTLGLVVILMAVSPVFEPKNNTKANGLSSSTAYGIYTEPKNTVDAVFLGDSITYSAVIPLKIWEKYAYATYCCGTSAQSLSTSLDILKNSFKTQSPKVVLLEASTLYNNLASLKNILDNGLNRALPVFEYHNRWKTLTKADFTEPVNYTFVVSEKGFFYRTDIQPANTAAYMKKSSENKNINALNKLYLKQIFNLCNVHSAKLTLFSVPNAVSWSYEKHNAVQALARELKIDYIDLNTTPEVNIDWSFDTRDKGDHLNYTGAAKCTDYLGKYLVETGLLKSRKGDRRYCDWDEFLAEFNAKVKKDYS